MSAGFTRYGAVGARLSGGRGGGAGAVAAGSRAWPRRCCGDVRRSASRRSPSRVHRASGAVPGDRDAARRRLHGPPVLRVRRHRARAERPRTSSERWSLAGSRPLTSAHTARPDLPPPSPGALPGHRRAPQPFRKPTPIGVAVERLMLLDAVLGCPRRDLARHRARQGRALLGSAGDAPPAARSCRISSSATVDENVRPVLPRQAADRRLGRGPSTTSSCIWSRARVPVDFRAFLQRHAELLRALGAWTIRLWVPRHFREAEDVYRAAWTQEFGSPLRPSTADELRWFFAMRLAGPIRRFKSRGRGSQAVRPGPPRLQRTAVPRALSRLAARRRRASWTRRAHQPWRTPSVEADGRLEAECLPRSYLHLSSLVGTS